MYFAGREIFKVGRPLTITAGSRLNNRALIVSYSISSLCARTTVC
jgi:hypothetical protein